MRIAVGGEELKRTFQGLAEQTFQVDLGIADPGLIDYLSDLLVRFIRVDAIFKVRNLEGERLEEVVAMLSEAQQRTGTPQREIYRHIGDFTLFWTGVYPEQLRELKHPSRRDFLIDYQQQGKRSYSIASSLEIEESNSLLLHRLSREFETCSFGLRKVREAWSRLGKPTSDSWDPDQN
ncbi:MAG: hypothetical protein R3C01_05415 [Planctomycetaceae bacterium]